MLRLQEEGYFLSRLMSRVRKRLQKKHSGVCLRGLLNNSLRMANKSHIIDQPAKGRECAFYIGVY